MVTARKYLRPFFPVFIYFGEFSFFPLRTAVKQVIWMRAAASGRISAARTKKNTNQIDFYKVHFSFRLNHFHLNFMFLFKISIFGDGKSNELATERIAFNFFF